VLNKKKKKKKPEHTSAISSSSTTPREIPEGMRLRVIPKTPAYPCLLQSYSQ
jgi:hypothetical protein